MTSIQKVRTDNGALARWLVDVLLLLSEHCSFSRYTCISFYLPASRPRHPQSPPPWAALAVEGQMPIVSFGTTGPGLCPLAEARMVGPWPLVPLTQGVLALPKPATTPTCADLGAWL